jgi:hypothetical protein
MPRFLGKSGRDLKNARCQSIGANRQPSPFQNVGYRTHFAEGDVLVAVWLPRAETRPFREA